MFLMDPHLPRRPRRPPMAASTGVFGVFRSSRVGLTMPSRIRRTISSPARLQAHQASRSSSRLRQARLTISLLSARLTRSVLVPARWAGGDWGLGLRQPPRRSHSCSVSALGPLMTGQRLRSPFRDLAGVVPDPGSRHLQRFRREGRAELALTVPWRQTFTGPSPRSKRSRPVPPRMPLQRLPKVLSAAAPRPGRTRPSRSAAQGSECR